MKTIIQTLSIITVLSLTLFSCGGKVINYPEVNKPLFDEGDSFVFKDLFSEISDTMIVTGIVFSYEDHDEDLIENIVIWFRNSIKEANKLFINAYPEGSRIEFLNISNYTGSVDRAMDTLFIDGKEYTNAYKIVPSKEPSNTDELEYLIYDYNYGLLKYKYYEGFEFVLDTVISSIPE